ncbi:MAG: RluA family pseudouridine synthase [Butyrivibrio sp.]|nr:RluA family pseudouridine synthase [Butyrivibrio sp.]
MRKDIRYIYEDEDLLVCHKEAGMATEGARVGSMDLVSAARNYLARKQREDSKGRQRNLPPYVATVHRLDAPVEGVVVLAKTKKAATDIAAQIKARKTDKYYYALCYGTFGEEKALLTDYLVRREDTSLAMVISEKQAKDITSDTVTLENGEKIRLISGGAKKASLEYEVIAKKDNMSLLRVHLLTGRFHQIRVQLSHLGCPIIGDTAYGSPESLECAQRHRIKSLCLVSYKFGLKHPTTKKHTEFSIEPDNQAIAELLNTIPKE